MFFSDAWCPPASPESAFCVTLCATETSAYGHIWPGIASAHANPTTFIKSTRSRTRRRARISFRSAEHTTATRTWLDPGAWTQPTVAPNQLLDRWRRSFASWSRRSRELVFEEGRPAMRKGLLLVAVFALSGAAATARAQSATGQITGTVRDATGAVVPGVTVTVDERADGREARGHHGAGRQLRGPAPARERVFGHGGAAGLPAREADRRSPQRRPDRPRGPRSADRRAHRGGRGAGGDGLAGHGDREHRPGDHREADHGPAAQRTELPAAALPGRGGGGGDGRAGHHAPGRGQRDQPHGRPPDLEQLHDRRDVEHGHRAGHSGRDPLRGRHRGVQGADQDLLRGIRLQRQPDQPREQVRHQRVPRRAVRVRPERGARRQELLRPATAEKPELDQKQFGGT